MPTASQARLALLLFCAASCTRSGGSAPSRVLDDESARAPASTERPSTGSASVWVVLLDDRIRTKAAWIAEAEDVAERIRSSRERLKVERCEAGRFLTVRGEAGEQLESSFIDERSRSAGVTVEPISFLRIPEEAPSDEKERENKQRCDVDTGWNLDKIGLPRLDASVAPCVPVAVLDSGVDYGHPVFDVDRLWQGEERTRDTPGSDGCSVTGYCDLGDRSPGSTWRHEHGFDFRCCRGTPMPGRERRARHGTHVAGIIAGDKVGICRQFQPGQPPGDPKPACGVALDGCDDWTVSAPGEEEAGLIAVRMLKVSKYEPPNLCRVIQAIRYSVEHGAKVINASWGLEESSTPLKRAVACACRHDVLWVAAAGNSGKGTCSYPACDELPNILSVLATTPDDRVHKDSTRGDHVDVGAPGYCIRSAYKTNDYARKDGSSQAAAHVAAAAALLWGQEQYRTYSAFQIRDRLLSEGVQIHDPNTDSVSGLRLDLPRLLGPED